MPKSLPKRTAARPCLSYLCRVLLALARQLPRPGVVTPPVRLLAGRKGGVARLYLHVRAPQQPPLQRHVRSVALLPLAQVPSAHGCLTAAPALLSWSSRRAVPCNQNFSRDCLHTEGRTCACASPCALQYSGLDGSPPAAVGSRDQPEPPLDAFPMPHRRAPQSRAAGVEKVCDEVTF